MNTSTALVDTERCGSVALLTLNHAPVNSLSHPVRLALWHALVAADEDASVSAIVLTGAGRGFCAGGDLAELHLPVQQAWPGISSHLLPRIEGCAKPVIAAMHGFAIGGGLELALACHHRVAERGTRIALPEIKHGVIPPSGSQRMPRAVGVQRALALIVSGETVPAETFAGSMLFDRVCEGDVVAAALDVAATLNFGQPPAHALLRHRPLAAADAQAALAEWRERLASLPHATPAMWHCIDAVALAAFASDFDSGLAAARQLHKKLTRLMSNREKCPP